MEDIDFSKISGWGDVTLNGELDGNGYSIKNLTINSTTNSTMHGLFDNITSGATVKNLNMENVNIDSSQSSIGALCGGVNYNTCGTIENCTVSGSIKGGNYTGGLVGYTYGTITNCSSSANVTGTYRTGGLVGYADGGTIDKSYATGDVKGTNEVGGLVGANYANISNSYALGNVEGDNSVGGFAGMNPGIISNSYSIGTVTASGSIVGGFVGANCGAGPDGTINNCYSTSEKDFNPDNYGTVTNSHGAGAQSGQTGVTGHDKSWFEDGNNLSFLGSAFDTSVIPPEIIGNERPIPPAQKGIQFQIGADSGEEYTLEIDTEFSLKGFSADVSTRESAEASLKKIDALLSEFSTRRSEYGATQNRLESVAQSLTTKINNLSASHSTIVDTDFAAESANFVKAQILQNATAALLAQANTNPNIALNLL